MHTLHNHHQDGDDGIMPSLGRVILIAVATFVATIANDILVIVLLYAESFHQDSIFDPIHGKWL